MTLLNIKTVFIYLTFTSIGQCDGQTTQTTRKNVRPFCRDCFGHGIDTSKDPNCKNGCIAYHADSKKKPYEEISTTVTTAATTNDKYWHLGGVFVGGDSSKRSRNWKSVFNRNFPGYNKNILIVLVGIVAFAVLSTGAIFMCRFYAFKNNRVGSLQEFTNKPFV